jgi:hypothetical protein
MFCFEAVTGVPLSADTIEVSDAGRRFLQPSALSKQRLAAHNTSPLIGNARPPQRRNRSERGGWLSRLLRDACAAAGASMPPP